MSLRASLIVASLSLATLAGSAQAATIATFADPTSGASPSLFQWSGVTSTLSGGWTGTGLSLLTPSTSAPDYSDVTFTFAPLVAVSSSGMIHTFGAGAIEFFSGVTSIFKIEFDTAVLNGVSSFGASDFMGYNVRFSGSILDVPVTNEAFAFSFANPTAAPQTQGFTVTSSFTSSATIPAPAGLSVLAAGALFAARRRRA